ncbi:MarR family winged helix-turn-helix transcriptional regulator [Cryptosporangium phraense]|uniref:Winged helix-turn-helix transcriptional regulator n=1 Tax=Cryptosporangium phraense TaxID=2593070 RepID=A0A545AZF8_9ACTN|nr:MarR family winged helix-turn-helix transcriptional regulator [Cryptosporangium phraense]TQS46716.1 winged helix-turn-helix transcriptional regulator [Cryptosporangium phraense]
MAVVPAPAPPSLPLSDDLGWSLGVLFRAYTKAAGFVMADVPGGPRGYQILATCVRDTPGTQLALAHQLGVDRTVMTYLLDDLEKAGLVTRQPDPADRRARRIVATETGRATLAELDKGLCEAEDRLLAGLPDGERATFRELLQRLAANVNLADPIHNACQAVEDIGER